MTLGCCATSSSSIPWCWASSTSVCVPELELPAQASHADKSGEEDMEDRVTALKHILFKTVVEDEEELLESIAVYSVPRTQVLLGQRDSSRAIGVHDHGCGLEGVLGQQCGRRGHLVKH